MKRVASSPNLSSSFTTEILDATANTTSLLRRRKNEELLQEELKKVKLSERQRWDLEYRQAEMRRNNPAAWSNIQARVDHVIDDKRRHRVRQQHEQEEEYKMELEKMRLRVQCQPTLFQRQSRVSVSMRVFMCTLTKFYPG